MSNHAFVIHASLCDVSFFLCTMLLHTRLLALEHFLDLFKCLSCLSYDGLLFCTCINEMEALPQSQVFVSAMCSVIHCSFFVCVGLVWSH